MFLYSSAFTLSIIRPRHLHVFSSCIRCASSNAPFSVPIDQPRNINPPIASSSEKVFKTGAFKSVLPDVNIGPTHFKQALRSLRNVKEDVTIKNIRNRNRKHAAQSLDTFMKALTMPITKLIAGYAALFKSIHPYEATVANLTVISRVKAGKPSLASALLKLKTLRTQTSVIAKEHAARANTANSAADARDILQAGIEALREIYEGNSEEVLALTELLGINKDFRRIPVIDLTVPTVVLLGSPNVGKSSIVRAVSSGTPEVNDYPFTTRGVSIGHIVDKDRDIRFQVMDTPGLLDRPEDERNEMEKLTYASLAHLPTAAIFVIDHSGLCGEQSNLRAQLNVRQALRSRFPRRPWIDVVSKGDLPIDLEVQKQLPEGCLVISVKDKRNIDRLKLEIEHMLFHLKTLI